MTHDTIRRLAEADPAQALDPSPSEELLTHTLALRRTPAPRARKASHSRRGVAVFVLALGAVVVAVGAGLLIDPRGPRALDLAAQAYAQTSAPPGEILHTVVTSSSTGAPAVDGEEAPTTGTIEEWHRGVETHRLETYVTPGGTRSTVEHVIDADGSMRQITGDGGYRIVRRSDNEDAANVIAQQQSGFVADFRRRYEQGELDPGGDAQFAGKPARRYVVAAGTGPEQVFYVDRETGAPLGYTSTMTSTMRVDGAPSGSSTMRYVQTVRKIERLAPTPETLGQLRTLSLPRRRDADGCIRGPVTNGRPSDTASRSDCRGAPGAPLPG